jgi:hypothetical protein
LENV